MKILFFAAGLIIATVAKGQTLQEVLKKAVENYPLLKAKGYEVQARRDQIDYARSTAVPSLDAAYQLNYSTYNNITGMAAAQGFVPISGPPSSTNDYAGVFGSVGGLLLNWDAFAFGQRKIVLWTGNVPVGQLVFASDTRSLSEISDLALFRVRPMFSTLPGVSAPPPFRGNQKTVIIKVNPEKIRNYKLTPDAAGYCFNLGGGKTGKVKAALPHMQALECNVQLILP